jgi:hypothetical protein
MNLTSITRLTAISLAVLLLNSQCRNDIEKRSVGPCDCAAGSVAEHKKDVEAVVCQIGGYQHMVVYALSTEPKDFETTSHHAGENMLMPCDSLPPAFRKPGLKVTVAYKRKDCYGALTSPNFRSMYGYYIDLTSIRTNP